MVGDGEEVSVVVGEEVEEEDERGELLVEGKEM